MAGIGFELRKILKKDSLLSVGKMYAYAGILSSGPWVISILAILMVGLINVLLAHATMEDTLRFQVIVTYAIAFASSLLVVGLVQFPFTRYVADLIFAKKEEDILSGYFGILIIVWGTGIPFIWLLVSYALPNQGFLLKLEAATVYLLLTAVWISNVLSTSLKYYKGVAAGYIIGYTLIVLFAYFYETDLEKLLLIYIVGNTILLVILISLIVKTYHSEEFFQFRFFSKEWYYWRIGLAGLFYNVGVWVDKFVFWYSPETGYDVIGRIHASVVYDLPIFMSYLSIVPGMAIFFYRLEADFSEFYDKFYDAVLHDGTLNVIEFYRNQMAFTIHQAIREILVYQAIVDILIFLLAPTMFEMLKIPLLYLDLFYVLTVGAMLQLGFMAILSILFYLDRQAEGMWLTFAFLVLNTVLSIITIKMGPTWFGYGYTGSLLIVFIAGLILLNHVMENLEYETFMLR